MYLFQSNRQDCQQLEGFRVTGFLRRWFLNPCPFPMVSVFQQMQRTWELASSCPPDYCVSDLPGLGQGEGTALPHVTHAPTESAGGTSNTQAP